MCKISESPPGRPQNQQGGVAYKQLSLSVVSLLSADYYSGIKAETCSNNHQKQAG